MASAVRLPLELFFEHESRHPNKTYLIQPMDGGRVEQLTWAEVGEQARRSASWLRSLELPQGSRIAIIGSLDIPLQNGAYFRQGRQKS